MHRAFREGRRVFISPPRNHFPLHEDATQVVAVCRRHRHHADDHHGASAARARAGRSSCTTAPRSRPSPASWPTWRRRRGATACSCTSRTKARAPISRAAAALSGRLSSLHLRLAALHGRRVRSRAGAGLARRGAAPRIFQRARGRPDCVNQPFVLKLARSGRSLDVPADRSATDVLAEAGIASTSNAATACAASAPPRYDAAASGDDRAPRLRAQRAGARAAGDPVLLAGAAAGGRDRARPLIESALAVDRVVGRPGAPGGAQGFIPSAVPLSGSDFYRIKDLLKVVNRRAA